MFHATPRVSGVAAAFAALSFAGVVGCGSLGSVGCSVERDTQTVTSAPPGSAKPAPAVDTSAPPRPKVVVLGDSLTAGYGLVESDSFPAALQRKMDAEGYRFQVENAGVSGDTSAGGLRRLDWALDGDVRVLIVALGGNDGLRGLSVAEMKSNLSAIVTHARERKVAVIIAGMEAPPNYGQEYAAKFRSVFREVAAEQRVLLIPFLLDKVAGRADLNQADGIHPNPQGAQLVAETVWSALRPVLDRLAATS
jgi:acyl-CoA thioesterase I